MTNAIVTNDSLTKRVTVVDSNPGGHDFLIPEIIFETEALTSNYRNSVAQAVSNLFNVGYGQDHPAQRAGGGARHSCGRWSGGEVSLKS